MLENAKNITFIRNRKKLKFKLEKGKVQISIGGLLFSVLNEVYFSASQKYPL